MSHLQPEGSQAPTAAAASPNDVTCAPTPMAKPLSQDTLIPDFPVNFYGGIDLGSFHSVVCGANASTPSVIELELNDLSGRSTPSVITFVERMRQVGETAEDKMASAPSETAALLPLLLTVSTPEDVERLSRRFGPLFCCRHAFNDEGQLQVKFGDSTHLLSPAQIVAPFLRKLATFAVEGRNEKTESPMASLSTGSFTIALPDSVYALGEVLKTRVSRACRTGALNVEGTRLCGQMTATMACWLVKNLDAVWAQIAALDEDSPKRLLIGFFNCGFSEASLSFLSITENVEGEVVPADSFVYKNKVVTVLAEAVNGEVGVFDMLKPLALFFESELNRRAQVPMLLTQAFTDSMSLSAKQRKAALRIIQTASKLMKELSGLSTAAASYSSDEVDLTVDVSRNQFESLASDALSRLSSFVAATFDQVSELGLHEQSVFVGLEVVGGGSRVPAVKKMLEEAVVNFKAAQSQVQLTSSEFILRRTLDGSAAAAMGAALISSEKAIELPGIVALRTVQNVWEAGTQRETFMHTEKVMREVEALETERLAAKNGLESKIMELESLCRQKDIKGVTELIAEVEKVSDWFHYDLDHTATPKMDYIAAMEKLDSQAQTFCEEHYAKEAEAKARVERELEEAAANQPIEEKEDHDRRKLPNSQRLSLATKNKDEGNDLFKGGNLKPAVVHYLKALNHLTKMVQGNPDEEEQKLNLDTLLNLNLAQVYLKEGSVEAARKAVGNCETVLKTQPDNTKALYRRGIALERTKDWAEARKALKRCLVLTESSPDPAAVKALERVEKQIKAENDKAKKMYGRMFG